MNIGKSNRRLAKLLWIAAITACLGVSCYGEVIANYTLPGGSLAADSADANITASSLITSGDFAVSGASETAYIGADKTADSLAGAISGADYVGFTITVNSGHTMDLTTLTFDHKFYQTSAGAITTSLSALISTSGSFTTADEEGTSTVNVEAGGSTYTVLTLADNYSVDLSGYQDLTGTIYFRIYAWDSNNFAYNTPRVDDIVLNGTVTAIPEPATMGMVGITGAVLLFVRRRFLI